MKNITKKLLESLNEADKYNSKIEIYQNAQKARDALKLLNLKNSSLIIGCINKTLRSIDSSTNKNKLGFGDVLYKKLEEYTRAANEMIDKNSKEE